jgi:hypothetical protein
MAGAAKHPRVPPALSKIKRALNIIRILLHLRDPLMMQLLNRQSETLRAGANYHLLGTMRGIEKRDRERFSQRPGQ